MTSASNFIATGILTTTVMVSLSVQHFYYVKQELSFDVKREDNYHMTATFIFLSFTSPIMLNAVLILSESKGHLSKGTV